MLSAERWIPEHRLDRFGAAAEPSLRDQRYDHGKLFESGREAGRFKRRAAYHWEQNVPLRYPLMTKEAEC
jgi:hypothetical protein